MDPLIFFSPLLLCCNTMSVCYSTVCDSNTTYKRAYISLAIIFFCLESNCEERVSSSIEMGDRSISYQRYP